MEDALVVSEDEEAGERRQEPEKVFGRKRLEQVADLLSAINPGSDEEAFDDEAALTALDVSQGKGCRHPAEEAGGCAAPGLDGFAGDEECLDLFETRSAELLDDGVDAGHNFGGGNQVPPVEEDTGGGAGDKGTAAGKSAEELGIIVVRMDPALESAERHRHAERLMCAFVFHISLKRRKLRPKPETTSLLSP
jgi:hypothetical protein